MEKLSKILLAFLLIVTSFGVSPVYAEDGEIVEPVDPTEVTEVTEEEIQEIAESIYVDEDGLINYDLGDEEVGEDVTITEENNESSEAQKTEEPSNVEKSVQTEDGIQISEDVNASQEKPIEADEQSTPSEEVVSEEMKDTENTSETQNKPSDTEPKTVEAEVVEDTRADGLDFNSKRLLVWSDDASMFESMTIISEYNGLYMLQFESVEETKEAYLKLLDIAEFVEPDVEVVATEGEQEEATPEEEPEIESSEEEVLTEEENAFVELNKELEKEEVFEEIKDEKQIVVALLDSGTREDSHVIGRVSMLGEDPNDDNGHGNNMLDYMIEENPDIKVLSVKVLNNEGKGNISSVVAGMEYAIEQGVDIINLSLNARSTLENSVINDYVNKATKKGIKIVASAGNGGYNVKYFVPSNIESVIVVASLDEEGNYLPESNFGETVDYGWIKANSTSEATARFSAELAKTNDLSFVEVSESVTNPFVNKNDDQKPTDDNGEVVSNDSIPVEGGSYSWTCSTAQEQLDTDRQQSSVYWNCRNEQIPDYSATTCSAAVSRHNSASSYVENNCSAPDPGPCGMGPGVYGNGYTWWQVASIADGTGILGRFEGDMFCIDPNTLFTNCGVYGEWTSANVPNGLEVAKVLKAFQLSDKSDSAYVWAQLRIWELVAGFSTYVTGGAYPDDQMWRLGDLGNTEDSSSISLDKTELTLLPGQTATVTDTSNQLTRNAFVADERAYWLGQKDNGLTVSELTSSGDKQVFVNNSFDVTLNNAFPLVKKIVITPHNTEEGSGSETFSVSAKFATGSQSFANFGEYLNNRSFYYYNGGEVTVRTPSGELKILKIDEETKRPITNPFVTQDGNSIEVNKITFALFFDDESPLVGTDADNNFTVEYNGKTLHAFKSENGTVVFPIDLSTGELLIGDIPAGKYYVKEWEVESQDDYFQINEGFYPIEILDGQQASVTIENASVPFGNLEIVKYDKNGNVVTNPYTGLDGKSFDVTNTFVVLMDNTSPYYNDPKFDAGVYSGVTSPNGSELHKVKNKAGQSEWTLGNEGRIVINDIPGYMGNAKYPEFTYYIKEIATNERIFSLEHDLVPVKVAKKAEVTANFIQNWKYAGFKMQKWDTESNKAVAQGDASLAGAKYSITNISGHDIYWMDGSTERKVANNAKVTDVVLDENGYFERAEFLMHGKYLVKEVSAPEGYLISAGGAYSTETEINIGEGLDNSIMMIDKTQKVVGDDVKEGTWDVFKVDKEYAQDNSNAPHSVAQGKATLAGAKFELYNRSKAAVMYDGREYAKDAKIATFTTDANGEFVTKELSYGTYEIIEVQAPVGYLLTGTLKATIQVREDGKIYSNDMNNDVIRGGFSITKKDTDLVTNYGQGDATDLTTTYTVKSLNNNPVKVEGTWYNSGEIVKTITTDNKGNFTSANNLLPYGDYEIEETIAPTGYMHEGQLKATIQIRNDKEIVKKDKDGKDLVVESGNTYTIGNVRLYNDVIRGGIEINKKDYDFDTNYNQGDAPNLKTEFDIINKSVNDVFVEGVRYKPNEVVKHIVTNDKGYWKSGNQLLPYGTYLIKETKAPTGYLVEDKYDDAGVEATFEIREDKVIVTTTKDGKIMNLESGKNCENDYALCDVVIRGGVDIQKRDYETKEAVPQGDGTFEGAYFKVTNTSNHDIILYTTDGEIRVAPGGVVPTVDGHREVVVKLVGNVKDNYTMITDENGVAHLPANFLPYGSYHVEEVKAPEGYTSKLGILERDFEIREEGVIVDMTSVDRSIQNVPARGDFEIRKTAFPFGNALGNVQFEIEHVKSGEKHIFTVDKNGYFTSDSRKSDIPHEHNTNQGGSQDGLWFGDISKVQTYDANGDYVGALLYGDYIIREIKGENNADYQMSEWTLNISKDEVSIDLNNGPNVRDITIRTKATSADGTKMLPAIKDAYVIDEVIMDNVDPSKTYTLLTELMDQVTGEAVLDENGEPYRAVKLVKPAAMSWTEEIGMIIDATRLNGHDIVFFETLFEGEYTIDNLPDISEKVADHRNINDANQTLTVPEIRTTATTNDMHVSPVIEEITIKDVVKYKDLQLGKKYYIEGELHKVAYDEEGNKIDGGIVEDAITGEEVVVKSKAFRPTNSEGEIEITFTFHGVKKGESYVAFETLLYGDEEYAIHADINDEEQSVYFPEIKTKAQSELGYKNVVAEEKSVIVDTVMYKELSPLETYVIKGQLYDKTNDKLLDIFAQTEPFNVENSKGEIELRFEFDGTAYKKHELVVFETLYAVKGETPEGEELELVEIADHKDPNDPEQTVYIETPELEKYVNKDVHEELEQFKEVFTYDIMAYVTTNADSVIIEDELVEVLEFVNVEGIKVQAKDANDHTVNSSVSLEGNPIAMFDEETGMGYILKIDGQKLEVEIPDVKEYRGKWIQVTFDSKIKDNYRTIDSLKGTPWLEVSDNTPVLGGAQEHAGVVNKASYKIVVGNEPKYRLDSNPVTVVPPTPEIKTTLADYEGKKNLIVDGVFTVTDTVFYSNFETGTSYIMRGKLVYSNGEDVIINGKPVEAISEKFIPEEKNGTVSLRFTVDASQLKDKQLVAFEKAFFVNAEGEEFEVTNHEDPKDPSQTVTIIDPTEPEIEKYVNKDVHQNLGSFREVFTYDIMGYITNDAEKVIFNDDLVDLLAFADNNVSVSVYDDNNHGVHGTVESEGKEFKDYKASINGNSLEVIIENAEPLRNKWVKVTFNAKLRDDIHLLDELHEKGQWLEITDDGPVLGGSLPHEGVKNDARYTIFVDNEGKLVEKHKDIPTNTVTVVPYIPKISTQAMDADSRFKEVKKEASKDLKIDASKIVVLDSKMRIKDTVAYENLDAKEEYIIKGVLMDKKSQKEYLVDGKPVTAQSEKFKPVSANGSVDLFFDIDGSKLELADSDVVVFEKLFVIEKGTNKEIEITNHADINDESQWIHIYYEVPTMKTTAKFSDNTKSHVNDGKVTIIDHIEYTGLDTTVEYTVKGVLVDMSGNPISKEFEVKFTPKERNGSIDMTIEVEEAKVKELKNVNTVVFEELYRSKDNLKIVEHKDLKDKNQTVYFYDSTRRLYRFVKTGAGKAVVGASVVLVVALVALLVFKNKNKEAKK